MFEQAVDTILKQRRNIMAGIILASLEPPRLTVPKGRKRIGIGLYKSMANQLCLTAKEFDDLLSCSLSAEAYDQKLREQKQFNETD
ncbi:MAG: hypothetical protein U5S82_14755 [Gammaproteobacteria bacterium]|nr:hypothetical protein [Gammaproteobacteria bacterium]